MKLRITCRSQTLISQCAEVSGFESLLEHHKDKQRWTPLIDPPNPLLLQVSCRFIFGGDQGRLRYGPAPGYSALFEAVRGKVEIVECFTFGNIEKQMYAGPSTAVLDYTPFVPKPKEIEEVRSGGESREKFRAS